MAGRTERVNARDLMDRADGIFFEGDVARDWLRQLRKRLRSTVSAAQRNRVFSGEWKPEYLELSQALSALEQAEEHLQIFMTAVAKRERART